MVNPYRGHQKVFDKFKQTFKSALEGPDNKSNTIYGNRPMTMLQNQTKKEYKYTKTHY